MDDEIDKLLLEEQRREAEAEEAYDLWHLEKFGMRASDPAWWTLSLNGPMKRVTSFQASGNWNVCLPAIPVIQE